MSTIVAPSTPIGRGAIAIVRLSGTKSLSILKKLCPEIDIVKPRRASLAQIYCGSSEILDEVLVTYFPQPHSVTGEDVVEISCHGSPAIVRQILDHAITLGARLAEPGEFTLRSLSNGKINLAQAEAIRDLIAAKTSAAAKQATRQAGGELSQALDVFKDELIRLIVLLESALEFVEDDLPPTKVEEIQSSLTVAGNGITQLAESFAAGRFLHDGIKVAIVGSPNVGKSSLFNRLVEQDRAIVTHIPGTTRDSLTHSIDVGGIPIQLTDTAGLRNTDDRIESLGIARTRRAIADADLVLNVVDASVGAESEGILNGNAPTILVLNKSDLPTSQKATSTEGIRVSALTGEGLDTLRAAILSQLYHDGNPQEGLLITNARHHDLLRSAAIEIHSAQVLIDDGTSEELILVPLHNALRFLGQITGETTTEEILSQVFSTFCIGK